MKLLVTGANGFIGSAIVERLLAEGHTVIASARNWTGMENSEQLIHVQIDMQQMLKKEMWLPHLQDVDGVINCAGILRAESPDQYEVIHVTAPLALAEACVEKGIDRFIQISALGKPEDGGFIASKHRCDLKLLDLNLPVTIFRPSVVVSLRGSYGGTSMLRGLAAFPKVLFLPGRGEQKIQPVLLEDLSSLAVEAVSRFKSFSGIVEVGGPEIVLLKAFLLGVRAWLRIPVKHVIAVPMPIIRIACQIGEKLRAGPLNKTILTMLQSGNVVTESEALHQFDTRPQSVLTAYKNQTSFVQDRWHARLFLLQPLIWLLLSSIWIFSAVAGYGAETGQFTSVLNAAGFPDAWHQSLVILTSTLDLVLGAFLLSRYRESLTLWLMLLSTLSYSFILGVMAPVLWFEPLGGLLKNLAIIPLLLVYMILRNPR